MTDGQQDKLSLQTRDGKKGYRITKFRLMAYEPGADNYESIVKIYKNEQDSATANIDFSDNTLLAAGFFTGDTTQQTMKWDTTIAEREIFNDDIFVTYNDLQGSDARMNYYLELEQINLDELENAVATLTSIKTGQ